MCALFVEALRSLAVIEDPARSELGLLPLLPDGWRGQSIDVARQFLAIPGLDSIYLVTHDVDAGLASALGRG